MGVPEAIYGYLLDVYLVREERPGLRNHAVLKRHVLRLFRGLHRFTALVEVHAARRPPHLH